MNLIKANEFYETDKKLYDLNKNKSFLKWYKNVIKSNYYPYMNIAEIQKLINKIANWYEIKYPEKELDKMDGIIDYGFKDLEDISKYMTVEQLLYRLSDYEPNILQCVYRSNGGGTVDIYKNGEVVGCKWQINMNINRKVDTTKPLYLRELNHFLVRADEKTGIVDKDYEINKYFNENRDISLEELSTIFEKHRELEFNELKECIFNHKVDLELRDKILDLVVLKLLYSKNTIPERGYIRAKKIIEEFNEYFNLNISTKEIDNIKKEYFSLEEEEKEKIYLIK